MRGIGVIGRTTYGRPADRTTRKHDAFLLLYKMIFPIAYSLWLTWIGK